MHFQRFTRRTVAPMGTWYEMYPERAFPLGKGIFYND